MLVKFYIKCRVTRKSFARYLRITNIIFVLSHPYVSLAESFVFDGSSYLINISIKEENGNSNEGEEEDQEKKNQKEEEEKIDEEEENDPGEKILKEEMIRKRKRGVQVDGDDDDDDESENEEVDKHSGDCSVIKRQQKMSVHNSNSTTKQSSSQNIRNKKRWICVGL